MPREIGQNLGEPPRVIQEPPVDFLEVFKKFLQERHEQGGKEEMLRAYFEYFKARPVYEDADRADFKSMREQLNSRPGLVIANHPSTLDTPSILSAMTRKDLKIVVAEKNLKSLSEIFGDKIFISVGKKPEDGLGAIRQSIEQIESGGAVLIYPSGGGDNIANGPNRKMQFMSGFGRILGKIPSDSMVYSFWVNPEDVRNALPGLEKGRSLDPDLLRDKKEITKIGIRERLSSAKEWQELMVGKSVADNRALAEHYKEIFSLGEG